MIKIDDMKQLAVDGPVVLTEDSLDAKQRHHHEGTQISPKVDGWPEHRVLNHLIQKKAKKGTGVKPQYKAKSQDKVESQDESESQDEANEIEKSKHTTKHGR